jgi:outer membrane lipoprotein-sorting protein
VIPPPRVWRRAAAALLVLLLGSERAARPADADVGAMLRELGRAGATVATLQARFVQEKHVAIVHDVLRSAGTFLLDKKIGVVWTLVEPGPARIVIRKDGVFVDGKRVNGVARVAGGEGADYSPLPILEGLNEIFAGISEQTTRDFEVVRIADERLRLEPRSAALGAWLSALEITLDAKTGTPAQVRIEEPGGDSTDITFSDLVVNPELGDAAFAP